MSSSEAESEASEQQQEEESEDSEDEQQEEAAENSDDEQQQDESDDSEDEEENEKKDVKPKIPVDTTRTEIKEKYDKRKGKSLYVLFPKRLPTDLNVLDAKVKLLCDRVIKVRRPRQPSARFCLVDFESAEDCKKAFKQMQTVEVDGKKLHVKIPKTDSDNFIEKLVELRKKKKADKRAKLKLKKSVKENTGKADKSYTASLMIRNIPTTATVAEIKELFPDSVELRMVFAKGPQETNSAIVTLPTPKDATKAQRLKIELGANKLQIGFTGGTKPEKKSPKKQPEPQEAEQSEAKPNKKNKKAKKLKKLNEDNGGVKLEKDSDEDNEAVEEKPKKKKRKTDDTVDNERTESPSKKCKKSKGQKEFKKPEISIKGEKDNETFKKNSPTKNFNRKFENNNKNFDKGQKSGSFNNKKKFDKSLKGGKQPFKNNRNFKKN